MTISMRPMSTKLGLIVHRIKKDIAYKERLIAAHYGERAMIHVDLEDMKTILKAIEE